MSERTAAALAAIDVLSERLTVLPTGPVRESLTEELGALRRAVSAFHMEAIRFRMHAVDRLLKQAGDDAARASFEDVRQALESAGFHTRSHAAP
jgi:hypothetical protein